MENSGGPTVLVRWELTQSRLRLPEEEEEEDDDDGGTEGGKRLVCSSNMGSSR